MKILVTSIVDIKKSAHNSRLHQFLKYLSKNHDITVLCINDWWKTEWDNKSIEYSKDFQDILNSVNIVYLTEKRISPIIQEIYSINTVKDILKNLGGFDIHFNYNSLISGYIAAKNIKANTIYDIADDLVAMIKTSPQINRMIRPIGGFVGEIALRNNINISKKITYTTDSLRYSSNIPIDKSELIPNGVDTELFRKYPPDGIKEELGIKNSFLIGYVGVLREWVDLEPLFIAVKQLNNKNFDIRLLILGGGIGYDDNIKLAKRYDLMKNIIFTGTIPYSQVPKYISIMDVCTIPFKSNQVSQNSSPLKLFEYMACEKPVISTKIEGIIPVVGDRVLFVSNELEYKDKILKLYEDENLRHEMGVEGRKFVENNYNWKNISSKLEKIMENVSRM